MARLTALPSIDVIRGYKGTLDFYLRRGVPCVRRWPHTPKSRRTPATIAAASLFGGILQSYRLVAPTVLEAYQDNAKGIPRTPRDVYVSGVLGHLHERTLPVPPPTTFTVWSPDAPPISPSALDDEFDDAAFDPALWSEFDPGAFLTVSENETGLILDQLTDPGDDISGIYQPIPAVDFSITAKLGLIALRQNFALIGLALWENATAPATPLYIWVLNYRTDDQMLELTRWTNYTTWNSTLWAAADVHILTALYFRIRRISATYAFDWSSDGIGWRNCWTGSLAFAPAHFGIILNNVDTPTTIRGIATFFRYTPYGTFNLLLQGDRIDADRSP